MAPAAAIWWHDMPVSDGTVPLVPVPRTSFVGRQRQIEELRTLLATNRLTTLSGAGGSGKARLAIEVAGRISDRFTAGACYVDCTPLAHPDLVAVTVARALRLPDQPGRTATDTLLNFLGDQQLLLLLDNCEHLLQPVALLVDALLAGCPNLTVLTTSREPIGVAGEVTWRVPSLSVNDEAVELFTDRARLVRPAFSLGDANRAVVTEICRRLDGMPLAIELAAARLRVMSPTEILDGLQDRFRLLTGGARSAVPRQQTLRASVDWSHGLLAPTERILFRRLAVFVGGFELDAVAAIAAGDGLESDQILDVLTLLIDKSLVIATETGNRTRYRLLETVREYALEKLHEADEPDTLRTRHRDFYAATATAIDALTRTSLEVALGLGIAEIDNFRAAFTWSRQHADDDAALAMASALQPLWLASGRILEGLAWFDAVLGSDGSAEATAATRAAALADRALLNSWVLGSEDTEQAELAVARARTYGDEALLARALTARGIVAAMHGETAEQYFTEAARLSRSVGDRWRLCQVLGWQANSAFLAGDPVVVRAATTEGREIADEIGDRFTSRQGRTWAAWAQSVTGDVAGAEAQLGMVATEAETDRDLIWWTVASHYRSQTDCYRGHSKAALAQLAPAVPAAESLGQMWIGNSRGVRATLSLADGDIDEAEHSSRIAYEWLAATPIHQQMYTYLRAEVALARGDLATARSRANEAVSSSSGWHRIVSLTARARVALAEREPELAEHDSYAALTLASDLGAMLAVPDLLECLAATACCGGGWPRAARLLGGAAGMRQRMGTVRFKTHDAGHDATVRATRDAMGDNDFDAAFAEGAALSVLDMVAFAQRGKGRRRRSTMGWGSLTPAEQDVVHLVCDGLANKEIATRLVVSPRTVQAHLTHIYTKLNLTSRVQLVQEASRHSE